MFYSPRHYLGMLTVRLPLDSSSSLFVIGTICMFKTRTLHRRHTSDSPPPNTHPTSHASRSYACLAPIAAISPPPHPHTTKTGKVMSSKTVLRPVVRPFTLTALDTVVYDYPQTDRYNDPPYIEARLRVVASAGITEGMITHPNGMCGPAPVQDNASSAQASGEFDRLCNVDPEKGTSIPLVVIATDNGEAGSPSVGLVALRWR